VFLFLTASLPLCDEQTLRLATTTSTENSGLLDYLLPTFEKETGLRVHVIAVGTGKALKLGENGDVDIVLVHALEAEKKFIESGFGEYRKDVMYNDFLLVGPKNDPAGLARSKSAKEAFKRMADAKVAFVSRGDDSGTHKKELALWKAANITPAGRWYVESGQGMGAVLLMASSMQAVTLTDRATYLKLKKKLDLVPLFEGDPALFNQYGIIPVSPKRHPGVASDSAGRLVEWITSPKGQKLIGAYGVSEYGKPLFFPNAKKNKN